jgi:hypothetical protein
LLSYTTHEGGQTLTKSVEFEEGTINTNSESHSHSVETGFEGNRNQGSLTEGGSISTVDLLVLTSFDQFFIYFKALYPFVTKQVTLMRRSTVLSLPLQLEFPANTEPNSCDLGEGSVRLTSSYSLVLISCFLYKIFVTFCYKTSYLNEEVNCSAPFYQIAHHYKPFQNIFNLIYLQPALQTTKLN